MVVIIKEERQDEIIKNLQEIGFNITHAEDDFIILSDGNFNITLEEK